MTKVRSKGSFILVLSILSVFSMALSACNGEDTNHPSDVADGVRLAPGTPDTPPTPSPTPSPTATPKDPTVMTIAVKYVALKNNASDAAAPTQNAVKTLMTNLSNTWSQCKIAFVLEDYSTPVASEYGLNYYVASFTDMDNMRRAFDDGKAALYVKTGLWNRSGALAGDGSNGYSTIPPATYEGTVLEDWVATNTLLVAHETGHLIGGLGHTSSTTNLMNHYVSSSTTLLSSSQCDEATAAMLQYHSAWIR